MVGLGHAELLRVAHEQAEQKAEDGRLQPPGQARPLMSEHARGSAEHALRHEVGAAPHAHVRSARYASWIAGNVGPVVTEPDYEHALAPKLVGAAVVEDVPYFCVRSAGPLRHDGIPIGAGGADDAAVGAPFG